MITVTGKIEDATGAALHARIDFTSQSTPLVGAGIVTTNTDASLLSDPSDGTFSVQLAPGNYTVVITANGETTTFNIAVPAGNGTASIETLVTTPLLYPYIAPNIVWNGILSGNITVSPVANPPDVTTEPVVYAGGHQTGTSSFNYRIAWQTANGGITLPSPDDCANTAPTGSNNATRVFLPTAPSGATATLIYRSNDGTSARYLLASVAPNVTYYDDWEDQADFAATFSQPQMPGYNSTAGGIIMASGNQAAYFTDKGVEFPGANARIALGKGLQIFNPDTGLWHTLLCTGNPAQLGLDAGNP